MADLYAVLKVVPDAPASVVAASYRALAKSLHPDVSGRDTYAEMVALNKAYEMLGDPARREEYDRELRERDRASAPDSRPRASAASDRDAEPRPRMPFGKHRGEPLDEIPSSYLVWAVRNLKHPIVRDVSAELHARKERKAWR